MLGLGEHYSDDPWTSKLKSATTTVFGLKGLELVVMQMELERAHSEVCQADFQRARWWALGVTCALGCVDRVRHSAKGTPPGFGSAAAWAEIQVELWTYFRDLNSRIRLSAKAEPPFAPCYVYISLRLVSPPPALCWQQRPSPLPSPFTTPAPHHGIQQRLQSRQAACACRARAGAETRSQYLPATDTHLPRLHR